MRNILILLFLTTFQVFADNAYSQITNISLDLEQVTIKSVLQEIENNSEFFFLYNSKLVDDVQLVDAHFEEEKIDELLAQVFDGTNIGYIIIDRQIIISPQGYLSEIKSKVQPITISGTVSDEDGNPIPGVNIIIKETTQGAISDANGKYSINVDDPSATLVFSFIGMVTQEVPVGNQTEINITMARDVVGLEEVVAIGYGIRKKSDLTGSVTRADIQSFKDQPNTSIVQSLQGTVPGLNVGAVTKAGQNSSLSIRGQNSFSGTRSPLIVLDGVIYRGSLIDLNINDIASVDVLKDASSKAIYGSQAANGVIIITTEGGKSATKPVFNVSSYYSCQTPPNNMPHLLNREEFLEQTSKVLWEDAYLAPEYTQDNPDFDPTNFWSFQSLVDGYHNGTNTDWLDLVTQTGVVHNTNISMAGNANRTSYYVSGGYTGQQGYVINDKYNKINLRANFENQLTDWLSIGMQSFISTADYSGVEAQLEEANTFTPLNTAYNEDGSLNLWPLSLRKNPLAYLNIDDLDKRLNLFGNFFAELKIPFIQGLTYRVNYSTNYRTNQRYQFDKYGYSGQGAAYKSHVTYMDRSIDNIVTYKRTFGERHDVALTAVYGYENRTGEHTYANSGIFLTPVLGYHSLESGSANQQSVSSGAWEENSLYQMGRLNYMFNEKYMTTLTLRRDGFSGFGSNTKFGVFPSASAAWVISREAFMADAIPWMSNLKIRASYGSSGNRTIGRYETLAKVSTDYVYVFGDGGSSAFGQHITKLENNDLGWETTTGLNLGLDFGLFKNRITGVIDYYDTKTEDVLFNINIPALTGFSTILSNIGEVANKGLEISLSSVNINRGDFIWETTVNFSRNINEIVSILGRDDDGDGVEDDLIANELFIGEPIRSIYQYSVAGMYQIGDDIPDGFRPGNYILKDLNGDDIITPEFDRSIIGYKEPAFRFSIYNEFKYKNWNLSVFINSIQSGKNGYMGNNTPNLADYKWESLILINFNSFREWDYWTPQNPDAEYCGMKYKNPIEPRIYKKRSFVRLQDVRLSYDIPKTALQRISVDELRLFFSGKNLYTWTNWIGIDPETGVGLTPRNYYPVMRSFSIGLNLTF